MARRKFNTKPAAWVTDTSRNVTRKFFGDTHDEAYQVAKAALLRAKAKAAANSEQTFERFYITHLGVVYSTDD